VIKECPNGLRLVSNGDKRRILTATGAATVPYEVDIWQMHCDRPTTIKIGDKWTFLFTSGRLMHEPPRFEKLSSFKDGYACVSECGVWGLIDETGRYVIEPHYEYLSPMVFDQTLADLALRCVVEQPKGLFKVHHHGQTFAVDCNGVESELPQRPLRKLDRVPLPNGTCLMHEHGSWGIADEDGSIIIPPVYRAVDTFREGVAWIAMDDRKLWMPIGPDGKQRSCLTAPRTAHCPVRSFDTEPKTLHEDPYESSVLWARWWLEALAEHRADAPPFGSP